MTKTIKTFKAAVYSLVFLFMIMIASSEMVSAEYASYGQAPNNGCYSRLLQDLGNNEQVSYVVNKNEYRDRIKDFGKDHLANAIQMIKLLLVEEMNCARNEVNFSEGPDRSARSSCQQFVPGESHSIVCFVESNLGYFVVSYGFLENVSIVFHRWD